MNNHYHVYGHDFQSYFKHFHVWYGGPQYQDLEEKLRKNAADREKQEQDRRGGTGCRGDPDSVQRAAKAGVRRRNRDQKPLISVKTTPGRASALPGKENDQPKRTRSRPQWGTQLAD